MSFAFDRRTNDSDPYTYDPYGDNWRSDGTPGLVEQFCNISQFLRGLKVKMRFGELSRAPLKLLNFQIFDEVVQCDWLARSPDPWDAGLSTRIQERHSSLQTIRDAIDVRALLFDVLPHAAAADFRVYRESSTNVREMIMTGCTHRVDNSSRCVHSLVMRAKILGFRFHMDGDALRSL
jgi:hypothetical protein